MIAYGFLLGLGLSLFGGGEATTWGIDCRWNQGCTMKAWYEDKPVLDPRDFSLRMMEGNT